MLSFLCGVLAAGSADAKEGSTGDGEVKPVAKATTLATTPAERLATEWWATRHKGKLAAKAEALAAGDDLRLVFIGDSITHGWERTAEARELWNKHYAPYGALNLGYGGDHTEHVLWRLGLEASADGVQENEAHNEVAGLTPDLFVLMIGTNNTGHRMDPPEATAAGIRAIVDRLQQLSPKSHVLLLSVFPRGETAAHPMRRRNVEINEQLAGLGERPGVTLLDIGRVFLDKEGALPKAIMPDGLHPNVKGYELWAEALHAVVEKRLGSATAPSQN